MSGKIVSAIKAMGLKEKIVIPSMKRIFSEKKPGIVSISQKTKQNL
jgi:hypothetical protein